MVLRRANTAITLTIRMIARLMGITVPDGLTAGCSSASAPGMDGAGVVATATVADLVTAVGSDMDVDMVMAPQGTATDAAATAVGLGTVA
jgi:hypothetical protein